MNKLSILELKKEMMKAKKEKSEKAKWYIMLIDSAQKIAKESNSDVTEEHIKSAAKKLVKMAKESLASGMDVKDELDFYESFLPKKMNQTQLMHIIVEFKNDNPDAKIGQIMGYLKKNFGDTVDMQMANKIIKDLNEV